MNSRNHVVDIAKGISILLVVLGHNWISTDGIQWLPRVLGGFRMPVFFFLSGVFFSSDKIWYRFLRRTESYLKPFAVVSLVAFTGFCILGGLHAMWLLGFVYGTGQSIPWPWSPMWFLPHLWLVWVFAVGFTRTVGWSKWSLWAKLGCLTVLLLAGGVLVQQFGKGSNWNWVRRLPFSGLPFSADLVLINAAFFLLGSVGRNVLLGVSNSLRLFAIVFGIWLFAQVFLPQAMDLNWRIYEHVLIVPFKALLGICLVVSLASVVGRIPRLAAIASYAGSGSLFILLFHAVIQDIVFDLVGKIGVVRWTGAGISFAAAIAGSLGAWELAKRNWILRKLLLSSD